MLSIKKDFATPEGAILCLEDAYRAEDLEAAVACMDFRTQARLTLTEANWPKEEIDDHLLDQTAEMLESSFRIEFQKNGFPDMKGVRSTFPSKKPYQDDIVVVTEVCWYPDGGTSRQKMLVANTDQGWRVLSPLD